jgi:putative oxidoreductase
MDGLKGFLNSQRGNAYLVLRLATGFLLLWHGYGKFFDRGLAGVEVLFDSFHLPAAVVLAPVVSFLELAGGIAIFLGVFTRLLGIWMVVQFGLIAIWVKPILIGRSFAGEMGFELDLLLFVLGALLATHGAGKVALGPKILKQGWAE